MPKLPKLPKPLERNLEAIDKVPLLERKREILAGRRYNRTKQAHGGQLPKGKGQIELSVSTAAKLAAEHSVSEKTVKRAGKFADEVAKTADTSTGSTRRAQHAVSEKEATGKRRDIGKPSPIKESPAQQVASR